MYDEEQITRILIDGGASPESAGTLAQVLALHYPEHAAILIDYQVGPVAAEPEEPAPEPGE